MGFPPGPVISSSQLPSIWRDSLMGVFEGLSAWCRSPPVMRQVNSALEDTQQNRAANRKSGDRLNREAAQIGR